MNTLMLARAVEVVLILALAVAAAACIMGLRQATRQARAGQAWWRGTAEALRMSMLGRGEPLHDLLRTVAMQCGGYPAVAAARDTATSRGSTVVFPTTDAMSHADEWVGSLSRWTHILKDTALAGGVVASSLAAALGISAMHLTGDAKAMFPYIVSGAGGVALCMGAAIVAGWIEVAVERMRVDAERAAGEAAQLVEVAIEAWRRAGLRASPVVPKTPMVGPPVSKERRAESVNPKLPIERLGSKQHQISDAPGSTSGSSETEGVPK